MNETTAANIKKYSDVIGGIEDFMLNNKDITIAEGVKVLQSVYLERLQRCLGVLNAIPESPQWTFPQYLRGLADVFERTIKGNS